MAKQTKVTIRKKILSLSGLWFAVLFTSTSYASDTMVIESTTIKGNTELPKIMYILPWQDVDVKDVTQQKVVLHSLFDEVYDPIVPPEPNANRVISTTEHTELHTTPID